MAPQNSKGTTLEVEIASVFVAIATVISLDGPNPEVQFVDDTNLSSEYVEDGELADMSTTGEVSGELLYDHTNVGHARLASDVVNGGVHRNYRIGLPPDASDAIEFEGSAKSFAPKFAAKERIKASFAIKLRSPATFPAAA